MGRKENVGDPGPGLSPVDLGYTIESGASRGSSGRVGFDSPHSAAALDFTEFSWQPWMPPIILTPEEAAQLTDEVLDSETSHADGSGGSPTREQIDWTSPSTWEYEI